MAILTPQYGISDPGDGTTTTAGYPVGNVGDIVLFYVATGETTDTLPTCTTPGFTQAADIAGGGGTWGNNAGVRHLTLFYWIADSSISGTVSATIGGSSSNRAIMSVAVRVSKDSGSWVIEHASGNKSTASTSLSVATSPSLSWSANDVVIMAGVSAFDAIGWSAEAVSSPGVTFSSLTERIDDNTTAGFDAKLVLADGTVTSGTPTGATTASASFSGSSTAGVLVTRISTAVAGSTPITASDSGTISATDSVTLVKNVALSDSGTISATDASSVLQIGDIPKAGSDTGTFSSTDSSSVNQIDAAENALNILLVVGDPTALATDGSGQNQYDHWTAAGHTVTLWDDGTPAPATMDADYDIVVISNSCPSTMSMTGYNTSTLPIIATGVRSPHSGYAQVAPTNGPTQTTQYVKTQGIGDPIVPSDITTAQDVQMVDTAFNTRYVLNVSYGSGVHQIAATDSANLTHLTMTRYDAGDQMFSGTAPSKRAWLMVHAGSLSGGTARGWEFLDNALAWATLATQPVNASDSGTISATESVSLTKTIALSDSGTLSATESRSVSSTTALSDAGTLSATESTAFSKTISLSDTGTLSAAESASLGGSTSQSASDSGSISATEARAVSSTSSRSDSGTLSATDISLVSKTIPITDSGTLSATESSVVFNNRPTTDSGVVSATESASVEIGGGVTKEVSDSGTISAVEAVSTGVTISVGDSGDISATEDAEISGTITASDIVTIGSVEDSEISKPLSSSDSGVLSATESVSISILQGTTVGVWTGTQMVFGTMKRWDGAQMVDVVISRWDGDSWV